MKKENKKNFKALSFEMKENKIVVEYQNNNEKFSCVYQINTKDTEELNDIKNLLGLTSPDFIGWVISKLKSVDLIIDRKELMERLGIA